MASWTVADPQRLAIEEPVTRLDLHVFSGRLNVVGTEGPARVEITQVGREPLIVECRAGTLSVRQETNWRGFLRWFAPFNRRYRVDVSVAVPPATSTDVRLIDGSVVASGLTGDADVNVTSGRVTLLGLTGRVHAKLVSGPVEAVGIGGDLSVETVSGELSIAESSAARVRASAISGSITCDLDNPPDGGDIRLDTTSGNITVRVREDSDLSVQLHTTSGRVTCAFPELAVRSGPFQVKDVRGVLGRGGGTLSANSTSGSVALLAREVPDEQVFGESAVDEDVS